MTPTQRIQEILDRLAGNAYYYGSKFEGKKLTPAINQATAAIEALVREGKIEELEKLLSEKQSLALDGRVVMVTLIEDRITELKGEQPNLTCSSCGKSDSTVKERVREALEKVFVWGVGTNAEDIQGNDEAYENLKIHAINEALAAIIQATEAVVPKAESAIPGEDTTAFDYGYSRGFNAACDSMLNSIRGDK